MASDSQWATQCPEGNDAPLVATSDPGGLVRSGRPGAVSSAPSGSFAAGSLVPDMPHPARTTPGPRYS